MTFATKVDATVWVDLQRADQVRGVWQVPASAPAVAPARRVELRTVAEYVQEWITRHPSARPGTKELYVGLLRTCIVEDLGRVPVTDLTAERVRRWHFELGERLAADADRRRAAVLAKGRQVSTASVSDGRTRQAQAYRLLRAAMSTAVTDGVIDAQPCRIRGAGTPKAALGRIPDLADRLLSPVQVAAVAEKMPPRYRALVLGATLPELMARLGHATPAAALVYLHARSDRDHALTDALGVAMSGAQALEGREGVASHRVLRVRT